MISKQNIQEKKGDPKISLAYAKQLEPIIDDIAKLEIEIRKKKKEIEDLESQINTKYAGVPEAKKLMDDFKDGIEVDNNQIANIIETSHSIIELTKRSYTANSAINFKVFMQFCDILYGRGDGVIKYQTKSGEQNTIDVEKTIALYKNEHPQSQLSIYLTTLFNAMNKLYDEVTNKIIKRSGSVSYTTKEESVSHINEVSFTKLKSAFNTFIGKLVNKVNSLYPFKNNIMSTLNNIKDNMVVNIKNESTSLGNTARGILREYSGYPEQRIFIPIVFDYYFNFESYLSDECIQQLNRIGIEVNNDTYTANITYIFKDIDDDFINSEIWINRTSILNKVDAAIKQWFVKNKDIITKATNETDDILNFTRILEDEYDTNKTVRQDIPSITQIDIMDDEDVQELYIAWQDGEFVDDDGFNYDSRMNDIDMDDSELFDN